MIFRPWLYPNEFAVLVYSQVAVRHLYKHQRRIYPGHIQSLYMLPQTVYNYMQETSGKTTASRVSVVPRVSSAQVV